MSNMLINKFQKANSETVVKMNPDNGRVEVVKAQFIWDNFMGKPDNYGNAKKYVNVVIPNQYVQGLLDLGYTVKNCPVDKDKDGNVMIDQTTGEPILIYYVKVMINMMSERTPSVKLTTTFNAETKTRTLDDNSIGDLHGLDIKLAGISWNRYIRKQGTKTSVTPYMDSLRVAAEEDAIEASFNDYISSISPDDDIITED